MYTQIYIIFRAQENQRKNKYILGYFYLYSYFPSVFYLCRYMFFCIVVLVPFFYYGFQSFHKNHENNKTLVFPYVFLPEGNFDIDAGDGVGGGIIQDPQPPQNLKQIVCTKIVHTSGTFLQKMLKRILNKSSTYLHIYRKYNESDKHIKNNN